MAEEDVSQLGRADWVYDDELGVHVPCCTVIVGGTRKCGNGPLTGEQIKRGECDEH